MNTLYDIKMITYTKGPCSLFIVYSFVLSFKEQQNSVDRAEHEDDYSFLNKGVENLSLSCKQLK